jgi:hypothetical protein
MDKRRVYTETELVGIASMLSDMLKEEAVFVQQEKDLMKAHSWLAEVISTLQYPNHYLEMLEGGGGKANFNLETAVLRINLPTECISDGEPRWGGTMPIEFCFTKTSSGGFIFAGSFSNEEISRNQ